MRPKHSNAKSLTKAPAEQVVKDIRRRTRRHFSAEDKMICPLLSGPISILELVTKEEWNGKEAQAGRDHRQAA
ncbi:hypothetical protein OIK40_11790 [Erythrobacter sp. sf7]|uniref:Uncharacterized protein n=1 Tax=Erythrobacter fulvus TaxID=2987523 RepID=A0ABT5JTE8_9SPHN|nr:hypothetical protein [Erythrobacter fulvus]